MTTTDHADNLPLLVRAGDYDRFLCIQLAPASARPGLYAVTALHVEIARIAEIVSEPLLGHIRLAWWREALEEIIAGQLPRNHPVVLALVEVYAAHPAVFVLLLRMIDARAADLDESLLAEEDAWLDYLDGTAGALHMAWALLLDADAATLHAMEIMGSARAYATVGLARAIPYMAAQGFLRFPVAQITQAELTSLAPGEPLKRFTSALLAGADNSLFLVKLPKTLLPLMGLLRLARAHKKSIRKFRYDPYRGKRMALAGVLRIMQMKLFLC